LNGAGSDPEEVFFQTTVYLAQSLKGHPRRRNRPFSHFDGIARPMIESAQGVLA
jgi:hypothetical protein